MSNTGKVQLQWKVDFFYVFAATLVCERTENLTVGSKGVRWALRAEGRRRYRLDLIEFFHI